PDGAEGPSPSNHRRQCAEDLRTDETAATPPGRSMMTMRTASIPSKGGTAEEPLRPAVTALAKRLCAVNGHVMGWHPVIGLPVREARA
ncbi:hypothetical protein LS48_14800, partial [Aequorivita aquimaris]